MGSLTEPDLGRLLSESVRHLNQGQANEAENLLRRALTVWPDVPQAQMLLAAARLAQGHAAEASSLLETVLASSPGQPKVLHYLGNARRALGDLEGALDAYLEAQRARPEFTENELALGAVLNALNRYEEAERVLVPLARREAENPLAADIENELGKAKMMQRRFAESLAHFERAIVVNPESPEAEPNRALALEYLRQPERAAGAWRRVLARNPLDLKAHLLLNELLHRSSASDEFLRSYDLARQARPHSPIPLIAKADQLLQLGRATEAAPLYQSALRLAPSEAAAHIGLGRAMAMLGESAAALAAFETGQSLLPDHGELKTAYAAFLLGQSDAAKARVLVESALAARPHDQPALAVLGLCYRASGDAREELLNGYDQLVQVDDLDPPDGYADMDSFHRDLIRDLDALHAEARQFFSQTLRGGSRSFENFFQHRHGLRDRLKQRIEETSRRYIAAMKDSKDHPFLGRRGRGFDFLGSWTSRMHDGGFHLNHIHNGWISAVYYAEVPPVTEDTVAKQGWLKFGEPSADLGFRGSIRRFVQPRPGRLVLFPSYLWHGTVPYHAAQTRTTIAFDLNPR